MTDAELSKELALALGWPVVIVGLASNPNGVFVHMDDGASEWREFDYADPTVCLPLIEWLMREYGGFFTRDVIGPHQAWYLPRCFPSMPDRSYPTLAEAVARAVIAVKGGG